MAQEYSAADRTVLAGAAPGVTVLAIDENLGYSASVNLGMRHAMAAGASWVLLLNNDATATPTCVARCLAEAERYERVATVGPAVVYRDRPERLWFAGARLHRGLAVVWHKGYRTPSSAPPASADTDYVPGCCALVSCDAWRDVGPLRDDYFMYFEDAEWGERARAARWRVRYLGEVLCEHAMAASSGTSGSRYLSENAAYYLARNPLRFARETPTRGLRLARTLGALVIWTAYNLTRISPRMWRTSGLALLEGLRDGWRGDMGRRGSREPARARARPQHRGER